MLALFDPSPVRINLNIHASVTLDDIINIFLIILPTNLIHLFSEIALMLLCNSRHLPGTWPFSGVRLTQMRK